MILYKLLVFQHHKIDFFTKRINLKVTPVKNQTIISIKYHIGKLSNAIIRLNHAIMKNKMNIHAIVLCLTNFAFPVSHITHLVISLTIIAKSIWEFHVYILTMSRRIKKKKEPSVRCMSDTIFFCYSTSAQCIRVKKKRKFQTETNVYLIYKRQKASNSLQRKCTRVCVYIFVRATPFCKRSKRRNKSNKRE